jgi:TonB family protein
MRRLSIVAVILLTRATFAASDGATSNPELPKAYALSTVTPRYPYEARAHHITGWGVCILHVDRASGTVTSVTFDQSTGHKILDDAAVEAFLQWRFRPESLKNDRVRVPVSFFMFDEPWGIDIALKAEKHGVPSPSANMSWREIWQEQISVWTGSHKTDCVEYFHKRRKALGLEDVTAQ